MTADPMWPMWTHKYADGRFGMVYTPDNDNNINFLISASDAAELRDALNEFYPPEANQEDISGAAFDEGYIQAIEAMYDDASAKWQEVSLDPRGAGHTYRLRVPGGWLYRTVTYRYPELHAQFEAHGDHNPQWRVDRNGMLMEKASQQREHWLQAQEVLTQTTVFVAES